MKILVLRFSSIGDIVLTTPVVRALAQQVPGAVVHFATKPGYRGLLDANMVNALGLRGDEGRGKLR